jgi:hypothetical protein
MSPCWCKVLTRSRLLFSLRIEMRRGSTAVRVPGYIVRVLPAPHFDHPVVPKLLSHARHVPGGKARTPRLALMKTAVAPRPKTSLLYLGSFAPGSEPPAFDPKDLLERVDRFREPCFVIRDGAHGRVGVTFSEGKQVACGKRRADSADAHKCIVNVSRDTVGAVGTLWHSYPKMPWKTQGCQRPPTGALRTRRAPLTCALSASSCHVESRHTRPIRTATNGT